MNLYKWISHGKFHTKKKWLGKLKEDEMRGPYFSLILFLCAFLDVSLIRFQCAFLIAVFQANQGDNSDTSLLLLTTTRD